MTENPYIVKEEKGEAYTIQQFVTGKPLTADEMLPDEHGIHPISPLGFLMKEDGTTLSPAEYTSGFMPYPASEPDVTYEDAMADSYVVDGRYYMYDYDVIAFPVISLVKTDGDLVAVVRGILPAHGTDSVTFRNTTSDDYTPTGLVGDGVVFVPTVAPDSVTGTSTLTFAPGSAVFDGIVGEGKLAMCVNTSHKYLAVKDPDSDTLSGIYELSGHTGVGIVKIFNIEPDGVSDGEECYSSNGYSDSEVAEWVDRKMSAINGSGMHPSSETGDLRGAGAFVNWFVNCGEVDITGGMGDNPVMVPGFGLGSGYGDSCSGDSRAIYETAPDDTAERPWLVFGYGTKHDALQVDVGKTALPLDWPFTDHSEFSTEAADNNITLIKEGAKCVGSTVGKLDRMAADTCETCDGTGEVAGETCPMCNGLGYTGVHHILMNRVHVCLYNDFKPSDNTHGHTSGTTVLKKTFVNLATPLTAKDGDEFEVTVSLPNVNLPDAYTGDSDDLKNLSAYYAYASQPRVYVVSGTWSFSETKVTFTTDSELTVFTLSGEFLDRAGDALDDIDVKVNISFSAVPGKKFTATGHVSGGVLTLDKTLELPAAIMNRVTRSGNAITGSICGAAYVEANNDTLPEGTTNLGLNSVRNADGALGDDMGNGEGVQVYNKLYTADAADANRQHVLYNSSEDDEVGPNQPSDMRQVVATVYPTVTNTFPWEITHRRKLGFLDKVMTMDADSGINGFYGKVYRMNRGILADAAGGEVPGEEFYPLDMTADLDAIESGNPGETGRMSFIGSVVSIFSSVDDDTCVDAQPVRRAIMAAGMLQSDFNNSRVSREKLDWLTSDYKIPEDDTSITSFSSFGSTIDMTLDNDYDKMANAIRLRHLPADIITAGIGPNGEPLSPTLECYPYAGSAYSYYNGNPYRYGEFDSTDRTDEVPCEVTDNVSVKAYGLSNSIVTACINAGISATQDTVGMTELVRAAELAAVDYSDAGVSSLLLKAPIDRYGMLEMFDGFTKLISPDNIPVPTASDYSSITEDYLPFITGDTYNYYIALNGGWEPGNNYFIATTMPTSDAVARFLKEYVPAYGARLALRNWDGYRTRVHESDTDSTVYYTRMKWYDPECDDTRGKYAADAFIVASAVGDVADGNMNRIEFSDASDSMYLDYSTPPYTCGRDYSNFAPFSTNNPDGKNAVGYIRVFMKFTFSEDAGRWYCTDYRQAPISYLSPLYGAKAIDQKLNGLPIWAKSACTPAGWESELYHTYEEYAPLDINIKLVPEIMTMDNGTRRLCIPYHQIEDGGLGLNAPVTADGSTTPEAVYGMQHANFWSVRANLRPATGATEFGDIPRYYKDSNGVKHYESTGGIMSDAVLWGQYDYPEKGLVDYHLPDTIIPDADLTLRRLIYAQRNETTRVMDTGDIQIGPYTGKVFSVSFGSGNE